jgi:hypothetical protein
VTNVKRGSVINPGLAAVVLRRIPIGVHHLYRVHTQEVTRVWSWVFGVAYLLAFQYVFLLKRTYNGSPTETRP